jgi:hypothetical protein
VAESCDHLNRTAQQGSISVRLHVSIDGAGVPPLESQFAISRWGGSRRAYPYAFTEQAVAMLSSVLRSKSAVQVNIGIMRACVRLREMIASNKGLARPSRIWKRNTMPNVCLLSKPFVNSWRSRITNPAASASRCEKSVIHAADVGSVAPAFARQQCLYFLPLPQGQSALRPIPWRRRGIMWSSDPVSW